MNYEKDLQTEVGEVLGFGFGFLYNRSWNEIREKLIQLKSNTGVCTYESNEKKRTLKYYTDDLRCNGLGKAYIHIKNPYHIYKIENK